jgi:hypothetical protein
MNQTVNHRFRSVLSGLTALGSSQATAFVLLNSADHQFTTVASSTGAILPPAKLPSSVTVFNGGADTLSVYPPVGGTVNAGDANAAYSLAAGDGIEFFAADLLTWYPNSGASSGGGSGTVNAGTSGQLAYYATSTAAVSGLSLSTLIAEMTGPRPFTALLGLGTVIVTGTNIPGAYDICPFAGTFTRWDIAIPAANQPSGASLVLDAYKSSNQGSTWTSLWATNTGNRPTVTTATNYGGGTAFDTTTFSAGDWLRFDCVTAGGGAVENVNLTISSRMGQ